MAALNLSPKPGDAEGNLLLVEREIAAALALEPSLRYVVLPELFTCAYSALECVYQYAEDAECGESARFFTGLAKEFGIYIAYGFPEGVARSPIGVFDSANLVGPEGVVATYRKRNLVGTTTEHFVFTPGTESQIVETGRIRVSLAVCWDMGFPEMAREAALGGADLILVPAAWRERAVGFSVRSLVRGASPRQWRLRGEREPDRRLPGSELRDPGSRLRPRRNTRLALLRRCERRNGGPHNLPALESPLRQHPRKERRGGAAGDRFLRIRHRATAGFGTTCVEQKTGRSLQKVGPKTPKPLGAVREPPNDEPF
ncbi:MAG TPA: carbon-nitrogen hydrolase family protein [Rubrobacter sp.]